MCTETVGNKNNPVSVSIIIPVYNTEKYIKMCLDSIISQTYRCYEVIIVNDGSTDSSGKICDEYARTNSNFKVFHIKNGGQNHARYEGLRNANSEYILFVDSDDWIDEDYIEKLVELNDNETFDFVTSGLIFENTSENTADRFVDGVEEGSYSKSDIWGNIIDRYFFDNNNFGQGITHSLSDKLIRKSFIMPIISNINKEITICEDGAVVFEMLLEATEIRVSHYCGYHYVQHNNSTIHSYKQEDLWRLSLLRDYYFGLFTQYGINNKVLINNFSKFICLNAEKATARSLGYEKKYSLVIPNRIPGERKRVIVYGAGVKGKEFINDLELCEEFSIIAWADINHRLSEYKDIELITPKKICDLDFDCIIIAIMNRYIAKEIENSLVDMGIPLRKIWIAQIEEKYIPLDS